MGQSRQGQTLSLGLLGEFLFRTLSGLIDLDIQKPLGLTNVKNRRLPGCPESLDLPGALIDLSHRDKGAN